MIKFVATLGGMPTVGLGLSAENLRRLLDDKPILVRGADLAIDFDILVFAGETEEDMKQQLIDTGIPIREFR